MNQWLMKRSHLNAHTDLLQKDQGNWIKNGDIDSKKTKQT